MEIADLSNNNMNNYLSSSQTALRLASMRVLGTAEFNQYKGNVRFTVRFYTVFD